MHSSRNLRDQHGPTRGATAMRRAVACALTTMLTLAVPSTGGINVALANPAASGTDGTDVHLIPQNAPEFWPEKKSYTITRIKVLIPESKALEIALKDQGVEKENVGRIEVELEEDDTPLAYEVELHIGNIEHEYEIEPYTGEIVSYNWEWEGDTPCPIIRRIK